MKYEVSVYDSYYEKRIDKKSFSKIQDARKYGYKLLMKYPNKYGGVVDVIFRGYSRYTNKKIIVLRDWYQIYAQHGKVYYATYERWSIWKMNPDGTLGKKIKG